MGSLTAKAADRLLLSSLRALSTVLGTALHPAVNTSGIKSTTDDVVTNPWQVLNTAATDQDNTVFLQVVANTWDVGGDFDQVRQTNTRVLPQSGVWLLRCHRPHTSSDPTLLRSRVIGKRLLLAVVTEVQGWRVRLRYLRFTTLTHQLVNGRHSKFLLPDYRYLFKSTHPGGSFFFIKKWPTRARSGNSPDRARGKPEHTGKKHL